jgi:hypothetical protein
MFDKRMLMKILGKLHTAELEDLYSIPRTMKTDELWGKTDGIHMKKLNTNIYLRFHRATVQYAKHHTIPHQPLLSMNRDLNLPVLRAWKSYFNLGKTSYCLRTGD